MTKSDELLGYIKASSHRARIIKAFKGKKQTPKELAVSTDIPISHVSNTLAELLEKKLVVCLTPERKKGRLYDLTKEGKNIIKDIT